MMGHKFKTLLSLGLLVSLSSLGSLAQSNGSANQKWWPAKGSIILGGGHIEDATFDKVAHKLIDLAGGPDALIVIIPTANEAVAPRLRGSGPPFDTDQLKKALASRGAHHVEILHTRDRKVANSKKFLATLRAAKGVWIPGGGSRILENTYVGTGVVTELQALLGRGGVIFGDSAGAIAIGCYSLGWTPDPWGILSKGFALLPYATVLPHASGAQGYVPSEETLKFLVDHPGPVGVVIDENTALVLKGSAAEAIGAGSVTLVEPSRNKRQPFLVLKAGKSVDLAKL